MQWVNRTLDRVYAQAATGPGRASMSTPDWKATRWALRTGENNLTEDQRALVNQIARTNRRIGRAWTLKEQLRDVYRVEHPPDGARHYLRRWITAAKRSRINAFVALGKRLQVYFDAVIAAIELGISNVWAPHCTSWDRSGSFGVGRGRGRAVGVIVAQGTDSFGLGGFGGGRTAGCRGHRCGGWSAARCCSSV